MKDEKTLFMNEFIIKNSKNYYVAIIAIVLGSHIAFGLEYCIQPVLPSISTDFSVSPSVASIAMSIGLVGLAAAMVIISIFADNLKRKQTMVIVLIVAATLAILIALSHNLHVIWLLRFIQGFLLAGYSALIAAYINEEFTPDITGKIIGIYICGNSVGGFFGRLFTSVLSDVFDWRIAVGFLGGLYLLMGIAFLYLLPKEKNYATKNISQIDILGEYKKVIKNPKLIILFFAGFTFMGSFSAIYNYISYLLIEPPYNLSQSFIGLLFFAYLFGGAASAIMGAFADKHGKGKMVIIGIFILLSGIYITLITNLWLKLFGLIIISIGFFGTHTVTYTWAVKSYSGNKARVASLYLFLFYIGGSVLGTTSGIFFASHGWFGLVTYISVFLIITLFLVFRYRHE